MRTPAVDQWLLAPPPPLPQPAPPAQACPDATDRSRPTDGGCRRRARVRRGTQCRPRGGVCTMAGVGAGCARRTGRGAQGGPAAHEGGGPAAAVHETQRLGQDDSPRGSWAVPPALRVPSTLGAGRLRKANSPHCVRQRFESQSECTRALSRCARGRGAPHPPPPNSKWRLSSVRRAALARVGPAAIAGGVRVHDRNNVRHDERKRGQREREKAAGMRERE